MFLLFSKKFIEINRQTDENKRTHKHTAHSKKIERCNKFFFRQRVKHQFVMPVITTVIERVVY